MFNAFRRIGFNTIRSGFSRRRLIPVLLCAAVAICATAVIKSACHNDAALQAVSSLVQRAAVLDLIGSCMGDERTVRLKAIALMSHGRHGDALALLSRIPTTRRTSIDWVRLAVTSAYTQRFDQALVCITESGVQTETLVRWGKENWIVFGGKENPILSKLWFTAASRKSSDTLRADASWEARRDLGVWWIYHDVERGVSCMEQVVREQPNDHWCNYLLARAYLSGSNPDQDKAIRHMERANRLVSPCNAAYCADLTKLYVDRGQVGDIDLAKAALRKCLMDHPENQVLAGLWERMATSTYAESIRK